MVDIVDGKSIEEHQVLIGSASSDVQSGGGFVGGADAGHELQGTKGVLFPKTGQSCQLTRGDRDNSDTFRRAHQLGRVRPDRDFIFQLSKLQDDVHRDRPVPLHKNGCLLFLKSRKSCSDNDLTQWHAGQDIHSQIIGHSRKLCSFDRYGDSRQYLAVGILDSPQNPSS